MEATRRIVSIALGRALNSYLLSFLPSLPSSPLLSFLLLAFFRTLPSSILAAHTFWGRTRTSNEVLLFLWRPYREHCQTEPRLREAASVGALPK